MLDRARVLVVDDESVVCESCRRVLSEEGYEVCTSTDPRQGLEQAQKENFELVIVDLKMPGVSGLEVLRGIKEKKPRTVVMIITAYPSVETAVKSGRLGAAEYLLKPFTPDDLCSKVREAIQTGGDRTPSGARAEEPALAVTQPPGVSSPAQVLILGAWKHADAIDEIARSEHCSVEVAYDAAGVLEKVRAGQAEILILGLDVFGKEAHDLIRDVKQVKNDTTVIAALSNSSQRFAQSAPSPGVVFYLVEPFAKEEIRAVIRGAAKKLPFSGKASCPI